MSHLSSLSRYFLIRIYCDWLSSVELCRLDSALCNHSERPGFLTLISHENIFYGGNLEPSIVVPYLQWITKRKLRVYQLAILRNVIQKHQNRSLKCLGFLKVLRIYHDDHRYRIGFMKLLPQCKNLEEILLSTGKLLTGEVLKVIADTCGHSLRKFTSLYQRTVSRGRISQRVMNKLYHGEISTSDLVYFATQCKSLRSVALHGFQNITDAVVLAFAENCTILEEVSFRNDRYLTCASFHALASHCPNIKSIHMPDVQLFSDVVVVNTFQQLATKCKHLQHLGFAFGSTIGAYRYAKNAITSACQEMTQLVSLSCSNFAYYCAAADCTFMQYMLENLAALTTFRVPNALQSLEHVKLFAENCHNLTDISVPNSFCLSDTVLATICNTAMNVIKLDISRCCALTTAGLHCLSSLTKLSHLGLRGMTYGFVTAEFVTALVSNCKTLQLLDIADNNATDLNNIKAAISVNNSTRIPSLHIEYDNEPPSLDYGATDKPTAGYYYSDLHESAALKGLSIDNGRVLRTECDL